MAKKINLSDSIKSYLKGNFDTVNSARLSGEEKKYYNKIKAGKAAAASNARLQGKYLSKTSKVYVKYIIPIAEKKGLTPEQYLEDNQASVINFVDKGYDIAERRTDSYIDSLSGMKRRFVFVEDKDGNIQRRDKKEVMNALALLQQKAMSLSTIVSVAVKTKVRLDGSIVFIMPTLEEIESIDDEENLINLLDGNDIAYIDSPKK